MQSSSSKVLAAASAPGKSGTLTGRGTEVFLPISAAEKATQHSFLKDLRLMLLSSSHRTLEVGAVGEDTRSMSCKQRGQQQSSGGQDLSRTQQPRLRRLMKRTETLYHRGFHIITLKTYCPDIFNVFCQFSGSLSFPRPREDLSAAVARAASVAKNSVRGCLYVRVFGPFGLGHMEKVTCEEFSREAKSCQVQKLSFLLQTAKQHAQQTLLVQVTKAKRS